MHNAEIIHEAARLRGEILRLCVARAWARVRRWPAK